MSDDEINRLALAVGNNNPWRTFIENCIAGDNYFRAMEYRDLIVDLDWQINRIAELEVATVHVRNDALEEAARICDELRGKFFERDDHWPHSLTADARVSCDDCAIDIRALKSQPKDAT